MRNILNTKKLYDWQEKIDKELAKVVQALTQMANFIPDQRKGAV